MAERSTLLNKAMAVLWLTVVWVLLWGDLSWANVLAGAVLGSLVVVIAPMPRVGFSARPWLPGIIVLIVRLAYDVVRASIQVAGQVLTFSRPPRGAVIRVQLASHDDLLLTLTAQISSLVPGSLIVEAHRLTGTLYIHVLDVSRGGIEEAREQLLSTERRLMYAFASKEQIAEAGLPPRRLLWRRKATEVTS